MRFSLFSIFFLYSILTFSQGHEVVLKVNGLTDSTAIVGYHYGNQKLILDTYDIDDKKRIVISGDESLPVGVYFMYANPFYFEFIVKEQFFQLTLDDSTGYKNMVVVGSDENIIFGIFQNRMAKIQQERTSITTELQGVMGEDSLKLRTSLSSLVEESRQFQDSLSESNLNSFVISFLSIREGITIPEFAEIEDDGKRRQLQYRYYKEHYFDHMGDPRTLMRTPVFHNYVMKYFNELVVPQADSVNQEIKMWLDQYEGDKEAFRYWLMTLYKKYQESKIMGMDGVTVFLADNYFLTDRVTFMSDEQKTKIEDELKFIRPNLIRKQAPPLVLLDTSLATFNIASLNQEYLVLFFYDPDCGICKKKTPILNAVYEDLKGVGAEVLAVCTITDVSKWKDYIKTNNLEWVNLGDPYHKSNFRMDYNVRTTPQLYILNKEREIIAKKLDVEQILDFIENYELLINQQLGE